MMFLCEEMRRMMPSMGFCTIMQGEGRGCECDLCWKVWKA